jgi:hypothetical protein
MTFVEQLALQLPLAAVVAVALYIVYTDGKKDRQYMIELLQTQFMLLIQLSGGKVSDHDETLTNRP